MKNPHIILLDDGKIWAFDPPEKLKSPTIGQSVEYERAYYRALEQKLEVENVDDVQRWLNSRGIIFMAPNEPIKWEGGCTIEEREVPTGGSGSTSYPIFEKVAVLIAPVKEGLIEKLNKVSDKLDAEDKGRRNLTSDQLAVNADAQHPKPVP